MSEKISDAISLKLQGEDVRIFQTRHRGLLRDYLRACVKRAVDDEVFFASVLFPNLTISQRSE